VKIGLASALLLVVVSLASWWWQQNAAKSRHEEIAQALVADHIHYLQEPDALEIASADPTTIAEWFHERVPFPVQIPHLNNGRLLGGRLCTLLGRKAALVLYERGGKRLSLFTLGADAVPGEEKEQMHPANADQPHCLRTFGKYALCFIGSEKAVRAIVGEEPEAKDFALNLFRSR
jgi:anti-sigma factor RsiW